MSKLKTDMKPSPGAIGYRQIQIFPGVINYKEGEGARKFDELNSYLIVNIHNELAEYTIPMGATHVTNSLLYSGDLSRLTCRAGSYMTPCGVQPRAKNNAKEQQEAGRSSLSEGLLKFMTEMCTSHHEAVDILLNNKSTTGFPTWTREVDYKMQNSRNILLSLDKVAAMWEKKDMGGLFHDFDMILAAHQTFRIQPDRSSIEVYPTSWKRKESKARKVVSFDNMETVANKKLDFSMFEANRVRLAVAYASSVNYVLRAVERSFSNYQSRFESMYKHRGMPHVASKLEGCIDTVATDFSNFDWSVKRWMIDTVIKNSGLLPWVEELVLASVGVPIAVTGDDLRTKGKVRMDGNPFDVQDMIDNPYMQGIPSGHGWVTFFGKIIGGHQGLMSLVGCGILPNDLEALKIEAYAVMKGVHPRVRVLNQGDDLLIGFIHQKDADIYRKYLSQSPHDELVVDVEEEKPTMFLGSYYMKTGERSWVGKPRIESMLVNSQVPERGIGGFMRPHWAIGFHEESSIYGESAGDNGNHLFPIVRAIRDQAYKKVYGISFANVVRHAYAQSLRVLGQEERDFQPINKDEALFIENPDRIFYDRVNERNIRPGLLESMFKKLRADVWVNSIERLVDTTRTVTPPTERALEKQFGWNEGSLSSLSTPIMSQPETTKNQFIL